MFRIDKIHKVYWFALFAFCFLAFQYVQDHLRPGYRGGNPVIQYFLGIAPNFFPAIGIPALFIVLLPAVIPDHHRVWKSVNRPTAALLLSTFGLLSWEFYQPFTKNGHFDWNDVLWTLLGGLVFLIVWKLTPPAFKAQDEATR